MNEFELIARYFSRPPRDTGFVAQAGGDDCALLSLGDRQLAVTTDLLVEGRHFLPDVDPAALGHKVLAVNLSDLAAAGATPRCFFLALALPRVEPAWLDAFSAGLYALADTHACVLAGGDTTRAAPVAQGQGPRTVCITAVGEVPAGLAHGRAGARPGDGTLPRASGSGYSGWRSPPNAKPLQLSVQQAEPRVRAFMPSRDPLSTLPPLWMGSDAPAPPRPWQG